MILTLREIKPVKVGHSFYFLIPKPFIDNGIVGVEKKYRLLIFDVESGEKS